MVKAKKHYLSGAPTQFNNSMAMRGKSLAQAYDGFGYLMREMVHPVEYRKALMTTQPGAAFWLSRYRDYASSHGTQLFTPHPGQQAVCDFLPTVPIIWLRPGQGFGKSAFNCWLVAKAIKREPVQLSDGSTWLPPRGKVLVGTKSRGAQADNMDGYLKKFLPEDLIMGAKVPGKSPYTIKDGAISGAKFTTGMELITRTYDSTVQGWMNLTLAMAVLDELPQDERILTEVLTRVARTGGILLISASDVYEETALAADRLKEAATLGLVKIIEGESTENPHLSKRGQKVLDQYYTEEERVTRILGQGSHSPLKLFPNYKRDHHYTDEMPHSLALSEASFIAGLDQGSPATPWAYCLIAYWTDFPNDHYLKGTNMAVACVVADFSGVGTNDEILEIIDTINHPFQIYPHFPPNSQLIVVGDPALKVISTSDATSSYDAVSEVYALITPFKPTLLSSFNFINDLFRKKKLYVQYNATCTHSNLYKLGKVRTNAKNIPVSIAGKDPLDAMRYAVHYIHAQPTLPLSPHKRPRY